MLLFLAAIFIIIIIVLVKQRASLQDQIKSNQNENKREGPNYEEINLSTIADEPEAKENIAYGHVIKQST